MDSNVLLTGMVSPFQNFKYALKSKDVQRQYPALLLRFLDFLQLKGDMEQKCKKLSEMAKENNTILNSYLIKYCIVQKERVIKNEISEGTLRNYLKAIKLFFEMNDIVLPWKRITKGLPTPKQASDDRCPTVEEIKKLIRSEDRRIKVVALIMLSSGIRVGAWNWLKWRHVIPIQDQTSTIVAAKLQVYVREKEEYYTFITPEAYSTLKDYMDFRQLHGEKITGDSYLIRDTWQKLDKQHGHRIGLAAYPKRMDSEGIRRMLYDAWKIQGVIRKNNYGNRTHEFKSSHGFRKFFETHAMGVMNSSNIELLMGHSSAMGLKKNYYKPTQDILLNDYLNAINDLTINEEHRLHRKVKKLEHEQDQIEFMKLEHEKEMRAIRKELVVVKKGHKELLDLLKPKKKLLGILNNEMS